MRAGNPEVAAQKPTFKAANDATPASPIVLIVLMVGLHIKCGTPCRLPQANRSFVIS
jgi:hypothetical protein